MAIALLSDDKQADNAPEQIQILPAGPDIIAYDGRSFTLPSAAALVNRMNGIGREFVIDFEHATTRKASQGEKAPAAGWIKSFYLNDNGEIWANVSWNTDAENAIISKEYKYISPSINYKEVTKEIVFIGGASLTNDPALTMQALCCSDKNDDLLLAELSAYFGVKHAESASALLSSAINKEAESILEGCFSRGVIIRSLEDDMRVICHSIGLSRFNSFIKKLEHNIEIMSAFRPALLNRQEIPGTRSNIRPENYTSDSEDEVCKTLGVSRESFLKAKGDIKNGR